jgi:hypothetical protein
MRRRQGRHISLGQFLASQHRFSFPHKLIERHFTAAVAAYHKNKDTDEQKNF